MKFLINGIAHYGWVKMSVGWNGAPTGHITAYAYETTANKKVGAGVTTGAVAADSANSRANDGTARVAGPSLGMFHWVHAGSICGGEMTSILDPHKPHCHASAHNQAIEKAQDWLGVQGGFSMGRPRSPLRPWRLRPA